MAFFDAFKNMFGKKPGEPVPTPEREAADALVSAEIPTGESSPDALTSSAEAIEHEGADPLPESPLTTETPDSADLSEAGMVASPAVDAEPSGEADEQVLPLYLTGENTRVESGPAEPEDGESAEATPQVDAALSGAEDAVPAEAPLASLLEAADEFTQDEDDLADSARVAATDQEPDAPDSWVGEVAEFSVPQNGDRPAHETQIEAHPAGELSASAEPESEERVLAFNFALPDPVEETPSEALTPDSETSTAAEPTVMAASAELDQGAKEDLASVAEEPSEEGADITESGEDDAPSEPEEAPTVSTPLPVERPRVKKNTAKITHMSELLAPPAPPAPPKGRPKAEAKEKKVSPPVKAKATRVSKPEPVPPLPAPKPKAVKSAKPEPAKAARQVERTPEPVRTREPQPPLPAPPVPPRVQSGRMAWGWSLAVAGGVVVGTLLGVLWYEAGPGKQKAVAAQGKADIQIKALKLELENERTAQMNVRTGQKRLFELLNDFHKDWNRIPGKPDYFKPVGAKSVIVFWTDGLVWRQYYLYQGKGADGPMNRVNAEPDKKTTVLIKTLSKGINRFSVSAVNKDGKETPRSEEVIVRWP